jgi:hypothetical protein
VKVVGQRRGPGVKYVLLAGYLGENLKGVLDREEARRIIEDDYMTLKRGGEYTCEFKNQRFHRCQRKIKLREHGDELVIEYNGEDHNHDYLDEVIKGGLPLQVQEHIDALLKWNYTTMPSVVLKSVNDNFAHMYFENRQNPRLRDFITQKKVEWYVESVRSKTKLDTITATRGSLYGKQYTFTHTCTHAHTHTHMHTHAHTHTHTCTHTHTHQHSHTHTLTHLDWAEPKLLSERIAAIDLGDDVDALTDALLSPVHRDELVVLNMQFFCSPDKMCKANAGCKGKCCYLTFTSPFLLHLA